MQIRHVRNVSHRKSLSGPDDLIVEAVLFDLGGSARVTNDDDDDDFDGLIIDGTGSLLLLFGEGWIFDDVNVDDDDESELRLFDVTVWW